MRLAPAWDAMSIGGPARENTMAQVAVVSGDGILAYPWCPSTRLDPAYRVQGPLDRAQLRRELVGEQKAFATGRDRNPDAHGVAQETVRELARQGSTGRETKTTKRLVRRATEEVRLRHEKGLERLRA